MSVTGLVEENNDELFTLAVCLVADFTSKTFCFLNPLFSF
jgi:hypothetical protein